jgi:hypothetical protein
MQEAWHNDRDDSITPPTEKPTTGELEKDIEPGHSIHAVEKDSNGEQAETQPDGEDTEESSNYLNGSGLYILSAAFTMAGIMLAIDGSILCESLPLHLSCWSPLISTRW